MVYSSTSTSESLTLLCQYEWGVGIMLAGHEASRIFSLSHYSSVCALILSFFLSYQ